MTVYVSQWDEERILDYFWLMNRQGADRLALLVQLSNVAIRRALEWDRAAVREAGVSLNGHFDRCFSCRTGDRRLYRHHVLEVQHGGSNSARNIVPLCLRCHAVVHPWLPVDRPGEKFGSGWSSISAMADRTRDTFFEEEIA